MRVGEMVRELVGECSTVMHGARLTAVSAAVEGITRGGRLSPASIGRNLPNAALPKHGIKRVDRLLGNPKMVAERRYIFAAISRRLLSGCTQPIILVDWTKSGGRFEAMVAAVPIGGRALPIYIEVHPLKKLGNAKVEARFLRALKAIIPPQCRSVIVSDAGFKGPFFKAVVAQRWDFLGRVRGTTKAVNSDGKTISKEQFYAQASTTPTDLGSFGLFTKQRIPCRLVLVRKRRRPGPKRPPPRNKEERELRKSALDPWLLATSLSDEAATSIVNIYAKRMQIEETFRDAKSHRFGWALGDVTLSTTDRMAVLLTVTALAYTVVALIGMAAERVGLHRAYQANTLTRRVLSFHYLATAILRRDGPGSLSRPAILEALTTIPATISVR